MQIQARCMAISRKGCEMVDSVAGGSESTKGQQGWFVIRGIIHGMQRTQDLHEQNYLYLQWRHNLLMHNWSASEDQWENKVAVLESEVSRLQRIVTKANKESDRMKQRQQKMD